jgi:ABC-type multidrug transport system ATPase subunit/predicted component of type VI protein secretion system
MQAISKLTVHEGTAPGQEVELTQNEMIMGRDSACDLVFPSPAISRRHARIFFQNGEYLLEDLGSSNGTFVNSKRLSVPHTLKDGDQIYLGKAIHLSFSAPEPESGRTVAGTWEGTLQVGIAPAQAQTMQGDDLPELQAMPPQLIVSVAGQDPRTYSLIKEHLTLGRSTENDIVVASPIVSGYHATLEREVLGYILKPNPSATNPIYYQGKPLTTDRLLNDGDVLRLGGQDPGLIVTLFYQWPAGAVMQVQQRQIEFGEKNQVQIGRDPSNDVVLDSPLISRFHAVVERVGQRYRARDLKSTNGTSVNDQPIEGETWLKAGDALRVGPFRFVLGQEGLTAYAETRGLRLEALGLNKWVRKDLNLLKDLYLLFQPREFVVVVGQSGGGKSTLVDAIAGYRPATHGQVLVNNIDIYRHFDSIRNEVGFVPQRDIIHMELTVYQALEYAARLRMPSDISEEERHQRIMEVLQDLDLAHRKDVQISGLSGGQQKRVSIGVELLTKPGLFFLDEPSSGLDPGTETALMHLMRRLADQGRTIILITHATKNVMLADKVLFLARGGYLAWFGPPDEALKFFDQHRTERDRRARPMEFDEIYAILDDPSRGNAEDWARRFAESPVYQEYIVKPLASLGRTVPGSWDASLQAASAEVETADAEDGGVTLKKPHTRQGRISGLRQFAILSSRNVKILTRDRISLFLMLFIPPLVAMLDVLLSFILGRDLFSYTDGNLKDVSTTLFLPAIFAIMVGALSTMREFVKEADIYKRERLVNLKVLPYVTSKFWVAVLLALYQAAAYTILHYIAFKMPGGVPEFALFYFTLALASLAGMSLGFLASAIAPNANAAPLIVILFIIPQVVLGGTLITVPDIASAPTSTRWAYEVLVSATGAGSDVAADACWDLPVEVRDNLSLDEKEARGCRCMGVAALDPQSCQFPGLGAFYDPALDQPEPVEPQSIGDPPPQPELPIAPQQPTDQTDQALMVQFFEDLKAYQDEVDRIQTEYKAQIDEYQARADVYQEEIIAYQENLARWEIDRNTAVSKAEAVIKRFKEDYGFAFVNKDDSDAYRSKILFAWGVQAGIIILVFTLILFIIYRKDRT